MMRIPLDKAEWWQTRAVWSFNGGTLGLEDSGSFSRGRRKENARKHRKAKERGDHPELDRETTDEWWMKR